MQMTTEMNTDGTMAVSAIYTCKASVNVRNSASEAEIKEAFEEASLLAAQKAIGDCGGHVKANVVEKQSKQKKTDKKEQDTAPVEKPHDNPSSGPLTNAAGLRNLL